MMTMLLYQLRNNEHYPVQFANIIIAEQQITAAEETETDETGEVYPF